MDLSVKKPRALNLSSMKKIAMKYVSNGPLGYIQRTTRIYLNDMDGLAAGSLHIWHLHFKWSFGIYTKNHKNMFKRHGWVSSRVSPYLASKPKLVICPNWIMQEMNGSTSKISQLVEMEKLALRKSA